MSNLKSKDLLSDGAVGASETDSPLSVTFEVSGEDSRVLSVDILYADAVVATGITAKLQTSPDSLNWIDTKTVAITGAVATTTLKSITLNPEVVGDQGFLPLRKYCRVVISSGAGDSATIDACYISTRLFEN